MRSASTSAGPRPCARSRYAAAIVACAAFTALALGPLTARSGAGVYQATECASWNTSSEAAYGELGHHMLAAGRACENGGNGLGIALPQGYLSGYGSYAWWMVNTPPGTHFNSVWMYQKGRSWDGWDAQVVTGGPAGWSSIGAWTDGAGVWRGLAAPPGNYTALVSQLVCVAGGGCNGSLQAGVYVRDLIFDMSDDVAPTVAQSGELLNGEVQRGTGGLDVAQADVGAGLTSAWVQVNDQEVARQGFACTGPPMHPCPSSSAGLQFRLDTQSAPFHNGQNAVQACAADYGAPPNVACTAKQAVKVDNSCSPSTVAGGSRLTAIFSRSRRATIQVKAGRGARLTGRLTDGAGDPVAGATLCTREAVVGGRMAALGTVTTNQNGRYRYRVSPGPNRRLKVGYRYHRDQVSRRALFKSGLQPRLKLLPKHRTANGKRLRLYGSIPGPRNNGRIVILQASTVGSQQWLTFRKARTDRHGNFRASYRFTSTDTTTRYRFRATVPPQNGYPYVGGKSGADKIKVLGR